MTALLTDEDAFKACRDRYRSDAFCRDTREEAFLAGARFARSSYEARLAEDAKVRAGLVEALRKLCAEVSATLGTIEAEMREAAGNTNVNVLTLRWTEAVAALAAAKDRG